MGRVQITAGVRWGSGQVTGVKMGEHRGQKYDTADQGNPENRSSGLRTRSQRDWYILPAGHWPDLRGRPRSSLMVVRRTIHYHCGKMARLTKGV